MWHGKAITVLKVRIRGDRTLPLKPLKLIYNVKLKPIDVIHQGNLDSNPLLAR
jgi:hypothetical protein